MSRFARRSECARRAFTAACGIPPTWDSVLIFLAIGIYSRNWISLAIVVVLPTLALLYRIQVEEAALREAFGEEYVAYSRTTKRLVPGVF